jgi:hypothetical protein
MMCQFDFCLAMVLLIAGQILTDSGFHSKSDKQIEQSES